ncbi:MAG: adenylyl-sulfate kinase [Psychrobium sp.]
MKDENVIWHQHTVDQHLRAKQKSQKPCVIWFTGLSGSGKSTIAGALENALVARNQHTYLLDGDNVRHGLCGDLGFGDDDRKENIRRIGETAKLMSDAGLIVLSAFISPFTQERDSVRRMLAAGEFIEVHVATSLSVCENRDPKGLYKKARTGEIANFTGISSDYQPPISPELILQTDELSVEQSVEQLINYLTQSGYINE